MSFKYDGHFKLVVEGKDDVKKALEGLKHMPAYYVPDRLYPHTLESVKYNILREENATEPPIPTIAEMKGGRAGWDKYAIRLTAYKKRKANLSKRIKVAVEKQRQRNKELGAIRAAHKQAFQEKHKEALRAKELYNTLFSKK